MTWFLKKKNKSKKDFAALKKRNSNLFTLCMSREEEIHKLEKECVHWKEKALNFRRFHQ